MPPMQHIRARTLVVSPDRILDDGLVSFEAGRVAAVGPWREERRTLSGPVHEVDGAVCAGVCNMHAHLELSHLAGRTVAGRGFTAWVRSLIAQPMEELAPEALERAVERLAACGTALVADIGSRNPAMVARALDRVGVGYVLGVEFFGHGGLGGPGRDELPWPPGTAALSPAQWERVSAAGHALYSTAAPTLQRAKAWCAARGRLFPMHLAEHEGEAELLMTGGGEFADLLRVRVLPDDFIPPNCSPVEYARRLGLLNARTLAVHCVHLSDADLAALAASGAAACLCPRSNDYIGVGRAPWERLRDAGVPLCLGTDSLSSNHDLDVWNEALAVVRGSDGAISAREALDWLTRSPARILGLENTHGTLEPGKVAGYSIVPDELSRAL